MRLKYIGLLLAAVLGVLPASGISATCDGGTPPILPSFTPLPLQTPEPNPLGILRMGPFAYIPNTGANSVSIIDLSVSSLPAAAALTLDNVGIGPQGVAIDPSGKYIYVSNYAGGTVSVIQAPVHAVVATLPVGDGPASMALHAASGRLYVANQLAKTISVIDTATRTVIDTLMLDNIPDRLLIHPNGAQLYVLSQAASDLAIINTQTRVISNVRIFDGTNSRAARDMVIDSAGAAIYITLHDTGTASTYAAIVSTASNTVFFPTISLPGPPKGLAIHPAQARLYVMTDTHANDLCQISGYADVYVIDIASRQLVKTLSIPQGVDGINIDNRGWLYAANKKNTNNQLEILNSAQELVGQSMTVGTGPSVLGQVVGPELGGILALSSEGELSFSGTLPGAITERIVTVTNRGVLAFTIQQPNIVTDPPGTDLGFSVGADTCSGQTLEPDAQCQITLRFSPKSEGVVSAYFSVASTALTSQAPVPLAALGLPAPAPVVPPPPLPNIGGAGAFDPWALLVMAMAGAWGVMRRKTGKVSDLRLPEPFR